MHLVKQISSMTLMMNEQSWHKLTHPVSLMLVTVVAALTSASQVTEPTSTSLVMADYGAGGHAHTRRIFHTTVASIHSGSFLLGLSIVVKHAEVACASVYEDTKTTDTTDSDARDCLNEDDDYVVIKIMYMHLEAEEVFGGNAQGSAHSCTVVQQLCTCPGCILNTSSC